MVKLKIVLPLLLSVLITSCKKEPGPGGLASIKGKVYAYDFTSGLDTVAQGYIGDVRVYIGTADNTDSLQFDDMRTSYNGAFEFKSLRKGKYRIWVIAKSDTIIYTPTPDNMQYYIQEAEIRDKKEEVTLPDFIINI